MSFVSSARPVNIVGKTSSRLVVVAGRRRADRLGHRTLERERERESAWFPHAKYMSYSVSFVILLCPSVAMAALVVDRLFFPPHERQQR